MMVLTQLEALTAGKAAYGSASAAKCECTALCSNGVLQHIRGVLRIFIVSTGLRTYEAILTDLLFKQKKKINFV